MKRILALVLVLIMALSLTACGGGGGEKSEQEVYELKIGHSDTTTNLIHTTLEDFAKAVEERTDGRVKIQIFAAEQLGSNSAMSQMLEMGTLDAMMMPSGEEAKYAPKMTALSLPFLFSDYEHVYKVLDGEIGDEMIADLADHNMIQIAWWENGLRQFTNSKRAIETPEDMEGLKFRTPEDALTVATFEAFGASANPFAFSELYLALQQGTFDGQENPVANIYANSFQDVQKYLTMVNYQYQPKNMIFSLTTWNKLPEDLQKIVQDTAVEYGKVHRQAIVDSEAEQLEELKAAGMEVGYPDTQPFIDAAQSVYDDFYAQYDWAEDIVNQINALK